MNDPLVTGFAIDSGSIRMFDHIDTEGPMWSGSGARAVRLPVKFSKVFVNPPVIQLSTSMIDADSDRNLRLSLATEDRSAEGFVAVAKTWSDSRIGRLEITWTAIGEGIANSAPLWDV